MTAHPSPWRQMAARTAALALLLLVLAAPTQAADTPPCPPVAQAPTQAQIETGLREARDRGMLWRLEKDGQVGWLYGTLHVGKLAWAFPGPKVTEALRQAQTVALELDLTDPQMLLDFVNAVAKLKLAQTEVTMPPALLARISALFQVECLNATALAHRPALTQAMALAALSGRRDGFDPAFSQENMLTGFAKAAGKAVVSLETPASQLAAIAPEAPADLPAFVAQVVDSVESGQARRLLIRVADVWARGDMDALARYEEWCECLNTPAEREQMRRLNDERNIGLAQAIHAQLLLGNAVFAAVGALHMSGPQALPKLMAERGWTVQRVPFDPM